jgi:DNA-binding transcriptional LysR family regulator
VGLVNYGLYAATKYLKARGTPMQPQDLRQHTCLTFDPIGTEEWRLESKKGSARVAISGRVGLNNLSALKEFILQGDGIAYFPNFLIKDELASRKLVRVLSEWGSKPRPVHIVYPGQKHLSPKLSAFLSLAVEMLQDSFD